MTRLSLGNKSVLADFKDENSFFVESPKKISFITGFCIVA